MIDKWDESAKYEVKGSTSAAHVYMATTFNQDGFTWNHTATAGKILKGTISYGTIAQDIELQVPSSSTVSTYVTISGIKFELQANSTTCSIRTTSNNVVANLDLLW